MKKYQTDEERNAAKREAWKKASMRWREKNPEYINNYQSAHKDEIAAKNKQYYQEHKAEHSALTKRWYEEHKEEHAAYMKQTTPYEEYMNKLDKKEDVA